MKTRNSTTPKPAAAKKTPPSRKSSAKKTPPCDSGIESTTPETPKINSASASTAKLVNTDETTPSANVDLKPQQPVEQAKTSADTVEVTPETKVGTGAKTTRKVVVRKTPSRTKTPTSAKTVPRMTPKSQQAEKLKAGESSEKEEIGDANDVDSSMKEEFSISFVEEPLKKEEPSIENVEAAESVEEQNVMKDEELTQEKEDIIGVEKLLTVDLKAKQPTSSDAVEVTPESKVGTGAKTTRKVVVRKTPDRTKTPTSKTLPWKTLKLEQTEKLKAVEFSEKEEVTDSNNVDSSMKKESSISFVKDFVNKEEPSVENVEESKMMEDQKGEESPQEREDIIGMEKFSAVDLKAEQPVEQEKASADAAEETLKSKVGTGAKTTKKVVVKKTPSGTKTTKTPTSAKAVPKNTPKSEQAAKFKVEESSKKEEGVDAMDVDSARKEESSISNADKTAKKGEPFVDSVEDSKMVEDIIGVEKLSSVDLMAEQPVEQEKASADAAEETPKLKVGTGAKTTRKVVVKKTPSGTKTPTSTKAVPKNTPKSEQTAKFKVEESSKKEEGGDAMDVNSAKKEEYSISNADKTAKKGEPFVDNVEDSKMVEDQNVMNSEEPPQEKEDIIGVEKLSSVDLKAGQPVEQEKASADAAEETPKLKVGTGAKITRKVVVKKTLSGTNTPTSAKAVPKNTQKTAKFKVEESSKKEEGGDAMDVDSCKKKKSSISNAERPAQKGEHFVENIEHTKRVENQNVTVVIDPTQEKEKTIDVEHHLVPNVGKSPRHEDPVAVDFVEVSASQEPAIPRGEEEAKNEMREETNIIEDDMGSENEPVNMEEDIHEITGEDTTCEDEGHGNEQIEECRDQEVFAEFGEEEIATQDIPEHGEEAEAFEEENREINAAANERKMRKELEIFVDGLDRDAVEEDVKKAFENMGDVVEVRLHRNTSIDKNKGFVKFATKEQANRALSEMKNPLICGKRCRTGPIEDNDSLFLGNICNTWKVEAIKQKLEDYGLEGVQNITLVADARHEGLSRGFAFVEFSCHADAMLAYKRLQKPDAIFGHAERSAKVAFAEPLREPDPEVMAQVKSVFIDGVHPNLDEDQVREQIKEYGEIARIMLARNMSTAKRRDFGFVDFTTHEAAVACVEGINDKNLGVGNSKTKVKARLSNPLPKTQAIKGGMCGGFRLGRAGAGSFSKSGRGFGRGAPHAFNWPNFHRGRVFDGNVPNWRMGFPRDHDLDIQYPPFHRREMSGRGGSRDSFRGAHDAPHGRAVPARPNFERGRQNAPVRGRGMPIPTRRQPFSYGEEFNRTFGGRQFDDPYFYDGHAHGTKRPFFMTDQDPDYVEPSRQRPRWDYSDPAVSFHPPRYQDSFGAGTSRYSHDYYVAEYDEGSYSSFYGNDRPYGGGYYY